MGIRGRGAQKSLATSPQPPATPSGAKLSNDERELWKQITSSLPPDWFTSDNAPLLLLYIQVSCKSTKTYLAMNAISDSELKTPAGFKRHQKLFTAWMQLVNHTATLATRLKLTPASRMTATYARRKLKDFVGNGPRPWQRN